MRGNIILITLLIIGCVAANIRAEEIKLRPLDFSHPAVKAAIALQKARGSGELEVLWEQLSKKTREIWSPSGFREYHLSTEQKNRNALISKAELTGIRVITDNRIWVEASAPDLLVFKGFNFVKEEGLWKFASIERYLKQIEKDLNNLHDFVKISCSKHS